MTPRRRTPKPTPVARRRAPEPAAAPLDFFQPGTDYRLNRNYPPSVLTHFRCEAVEWDPDTNCWIASGQWAQGATGPREPHRLNAEEWGRGWVVASPTDDDDDVPQPGDSLVPRVLLDRIERHDAEARRSEDIARGLS